MNKRVKTIVDGGREPVLHTADLGLIPGTPQDLATSPGMVPSTELGISPTAKNKKTKTKKKRPTNQQQKKPPQRKHKFCMQEAWV